MPRNKRLSIMGHDEHTDNNNHKHQFDGSDNTKYPNNYPIHDYDDATINLINSSNMVNQFIDKSLISKNQYNTSLPVSRDYSSISTHSSSSSTSSSQSSPASSSSSPSSSQSSLSFTDPSTTIVTRDFVTVYEYKIGNHSIIWDYLIGWVYITSIWKAVGNSKADVLKLISTSPEIKNKVFKTKGGCLKVQGTWIQYDIAKKLASKFCWPIRFALVPIFGIDFIYSCLKFGQPGYGLFQLTVSEKDLNKKRRRKRKSITNSTTTTNNNKSKITTSSISNKKRKIHNREDNDEYEDNTNNWYPDRKSIFKSNKPIKFMDPDNDELDDLSYSEELDSEADLFDNHNNNNNNTNNNNNKFIEQSPIQHHSYLATSTPGYTYNSTIKSIPSINSSSNATSASSSISYYSGYPNLNSNLNSNSYQQLQSSNQIPLPLPNPYYSSFKPLSNDAILLPKLESTTTVHDSFRFEFTERRYSTNTDQFGSNGFANITNNHYNNYNNYVYNDNNKSTIPKQSGYKYSSSPESYNEVALARPVLSAAEGRNPNTLPRNSSVLLDSLLLVVTREMEELQETVDVEVDVDMAIKQPLGGAASAASAAGAGDSQPVGSFR